MAGPIRIAILANGAQARREIGQVQGTLGKLGKFGKTAALGAFGALTIGAAAFVKSSVDAERQYSTSMRLIQASTKASEAEMARLNDLAIKLGQDTSFSAGEAAGAMLELAKAGLNTKTIMGGGLAGTLTLAAAGGTDLATAATIASNALNTFNLSGRDMDRVAAALAGGANASTASVESLGQALQQVGPGATNAGLSLQETVAALSAFDAAGIKGSDAGTSLKTMLARLVPTTKAAREAMSDLGLDFVKGNGEFESLTNIAGQLRERLGQLAPAQRQVALQAIFGSDATRAATVLTREGAEGIRAYIKATNDQEAAQKAANARMSGTEGALEKLSGAVETAKLRLGQELAPAVIAGADALDDKLVPALETAIDAGRDIAGALAPAASEIAEALGRLAGEGDAAGRVFDDVFIPALRLASEVVGGLVNFVDELPGPLKEIGIQAGVAAFALPKLQAAITTTTTAVTTQVAKLQQWRAEMTYAETRAQNVSGVVSRLGGVARQAAGIGGLLALSSGFSAASDEGSTFSSVMQGAAGGAGIGAMFGPVGALVGAAAGGGLSALAGAFSRTNDEAKATRLELLRTEGFQNAEADAGSLRNALMGVVHAYGRIPRAAVEASFTGDDGKLDADIAKLRELGVSMDTIVSATMGQADAQEIVNRALTRGLAPAEVMLARLKARYDDAKDGAIDLVTATGEVIRNGHRIDETALEGYRQEYETAKARVEDLQAAQDTFGERIRQNTGAIADHKEQVRTLAGQLGITVKEYNRFPKAVRTQIEGKGLPQTNRDAVRLIARYKGLQGFKSIRAVVSAPGVDVTARQIRTLHRQYDLTPRQVRTLLRMEGYESTRRDVRRILADLEDVDRQTPMPKLRADTGPFKKDKGAADRDLDAFGKRSESAELRINRGPMQADIELVTAALNRIPDEYVTIWVTRRERSGGGGSSDRTTPRMTPRTTFQVPTDTEDPFGFERVAGKAQTAAARLGRKTGKSLLDQILANVTAGGGAIANALDRISDYVSNKLERQEAERAQAIKRRLDGKAEAKALRELEARYKRLGRTVKRQLDDEYAALRRNGKAQDQLNAKLEKARQHLQEVRGWVAQVRDTFIQTGNVTQLGQLEDGSVSGGLLLDQLRQQAEDAERFAELIRNLTDSTGAKINKTTLDQLLAAGPEAGLATAEALAAGGDAAIREINQLTDRISDAGQSLGAEMSNQFFDVGLQAAEGIVKGLEAQQRQLDRIAERLARRLAAAVRKALGIKSPSRVFRDIGEHTLKGLEIGIDDTYAARIGTVAAEQLVKGFGTPALNAYTQAADAGQLGGVHVLRIELSGEAQDAIRAGRRVSAEVGSAGAAGLRVLAVRAGG